MNIKILEVITWFIIERRISSSDALWLGIFLLITIKQPKRLESIKTTLNLLNKRLLCHFDRF